MELAATDFEVFSAKDRPRLRNTQSKLPGASGCPSRMIAGRRRVVC